MARPLAPSMWCHLWSTGCSRSGIAHIGVWRSIMILPLSSLLLVSLQIILTKPVLPRALSDAALGRLREALLSNSLYSGSVQNPVVNRGSVSVSNVKQDL